MLLVFNPVISVSVGWVDHLWDNFVVCLHNQNSPRVLVLTAIIGGRKNCYQLTLGEPFESVHNTLMGSDNHIEVILLQETFDSVWPEFHDVTSLGRISQMIGVNSKFTV